MLRKSLLVMTLGVLSACHLPAPDGRSVTHAISDEESAATFLGQALAPQIARHPGLSGVVSLNESLDAFAARMVLISAAQRSIDIQYYIWRDDITGNLLLKALHDAAARNVRVRLLIDDNGTTGLDDKLALLNAEPNVEVRLFNPFPFRTFKQLGFLIDFQRLNRRMHNKSLTVDGQITIVGGRNIGDEYFGATQGVAFADLDVMVAGPAVNEVSQDFDRYWNAEPAYPLEALISTPGKRKSQALLQEEAAAAFIPQAHAYIDAVQRSTFMEKLMAGTLEYLWAPVRMVSDDPDKVLGRAQPESLLTSHLNNILGTPEHSVDLISPYFVPTQQGVEALSALANQGARLRILTNAMESTDVVAVHAGYSKYRLPLLKNGITLYEMRRDSDPDRPKEKAGPFGSSGSSLHAKTFAVDGRRVFVGSFNFDPRSARLNTELGFVIENKAMAEAISREFEHSIPQHAYQLELVDDDIVWIGRDADGELRTWTQEPAASFWKRLYIRFLSLLPIEPLL